MPNPQSNTPTDEELKQKLKNFSAKLKEERNSRSPRATRIRLNNPESLASLFGMPMVKIDPRSIDRIVNALLGEPYDPRSNEARRD